LCKWKPYGNPDSLVDDDFEWPSISIVVWPHASQAEIPEAIKQTRMASAELSKIIAGREELVYRKSTVYWQEYVNVVIGHKATDTKGK
jgi:hypothetical protein